MPLKPPLPAHAAPREATGFGATPEAAADGLLLLLACAGGAAAVSAAPAELRAAAC
jgi:hypothetical protein